MLAHVMPSGDAPASKPFFPGASAYLLALIALPTVILNRALLPALYGSRTGIGRLINVITRVGDFSSQVLALGSFLVLLRLVLWALRRTELGNTTRLITLPLCIGTGLLLLAAASNPLPPELGLFLAFSSSGAALACSLLAMGRPSVRAGGILVAIVSTCCLIQEGSRLWVVQSSYGAAADYRMLRAFATVAVSLDALSLLWTLVWCGLASNHGRRTLVLLGVAAASALAVPWFLGASQSFAVELLQRSTRALLRNPSPFFPTALQQGLEILAVVVAIGLLVTPRGQHRWLRAAMVLVIAARCSPDVPAQAGLLAVGALLLGLLAIAPVTGKNELGAPEPSLATVEGGATEIPHGELTTKDP